MKKQVFSDLSEGAKTRARARHGVLKKRRPIVADIGHCTKADMTYLKSILDAAQVTDRLTGEFSPGRYASLARECDREEKRAGRRKKAQAEAQRKAANAQVRAAARQWKADHPHCGARTRKGTPCQCPPVAFCDRCRLHGGLSTGPMKKLVFSEKTQ